MATLIIYRDNRLHERVALGEGTLRVGRAPENDLVLPDASKGVSRHHAEIRFEGGRYVVADLNSQNGVWLGERRVRLDPLPPGVPLTIGPYLLTLEDAPVAAPAVGEAAPDAQSEAIPATITDTAAPSSAPIAAATVTPGPDRRPAAYGLGALAAVLVLALIGWQFLRSKPSLESTQAKVTTSVPTTTIPPSPPAPPPVDPAFESHYQQAQTYLEAADKENARRENDEAVKLAADDERARKQREAIEALADPSPRGPEGPPPAGSGRDEGRGARSGALLVKPKQGETPSQRASRQRNAEGDLSDGLKALGDHRYAAALSSLESAISVSGRQDFGTTPNEARDRLAEARAAIAAAEETKRRDQAVQLLNEAKASGANDLVTSVRKLRQAREIDQTVGGADLLAGWEAQAKSEGEASLGRARTYDNYPSRKADALSQYQRAATLLDLVPGGHPGLAEARARIEQLKSGR